jgi:Heparinase II/III-like protein
MLRKIAVIITLLYFAAFLFAEQEPILNQVGKELFSGLFKADYLEPPIEQYLPVNQLLFSEIKLPNSPQHPCLLFNSSNINTIRKKRFRSPYSNWANNIIHSAITYPHDANSPLICEFDRSKIAKINAFSWFLTGNTEYLSEAREALLNILETSYPINGEGGVPGKKWGDWMQAADALRNYSVAYDLIYHELTEKQIAFVEKKLADKTRQIHNYCQHFPTTMNQVDLSLGVGITKNNHIIKIATGIATASMVLNNPNAEKWFADAISQLQFGLSMIMADGSFQEGPAYGTYINYCLYPFFFYIHNVTKENLFRHPQIVKFNQWLIDLQLPDGSYPFIDDTWETSYLYQPIGVGLSPLQKELSYLYTHNEKNFYPYDLNYVEAFCAFIDRVQPRTPEYNNFYPDGGFSIFRGDKDIVGTLSGEPGRPFISYHDHVEPGSFTLFASGRHFIIDGGYGPEGMKDKNRSWFISTRAHNIPLVNGLGPDRNPIWGDDLGADMKNFFSMDDLTASTVSANYRDTEITRRAWLVNDDFFVVYDQFYSEEENRYSIPWHSLGKFKKTSHNKVSWQQEDTQLRAEFLTVNKKPFTISSRLGLDTHRASSEKPHSIAEISFSPSKKAELVTLFLPVNINDSAIIIEPLAVNSSHHIDARIISNQENFNTTKIILASSNWECGTIKSDAKLAIIQEIENQMVFSLESATYLEYDNEMIFESDKLINITYDFKERNCFIVVAKDSSVNMLFHHSIDPGIVILDKQIVQYKYNNDKLTFKVDRSGILQFGSIISNISTTEKAREDLPILEILNSSPFPEEEFSNLNYYEKRKLRNEIINIAAPQTLNAANEIFGKENLLQNIYKLSTGFLRDTYQSFENLRFRFPQSFRFDRKFGNYSMRYYEEGFIHQDGLRIGKHRFSVKKGDKSLYYSYDQDFTNYQSNSLQIHYGNYSTRTDWQNYQSDYSYLVELSKYDEIGGLYMSHQQDNFNHFRTNNLSFSHKNLSSDISHYNDRDINEFDISFQKSSEKLSFGLNTTLSDKKGFEIISLTNSVDLSNNSALTNNLLLQKLRPDESLKYALDSSIATQFCGVNNSTIFTKTLENNIFIYNKMYYKFDNWRLAASVIHDSLLFGEFSCAFREIDYSAQLSLQNRQEINVSASYNIDQIWTSMVDVSWNHKNHECENLMIGLFYNDLQRLGTQILFKNCYSYQCYGLAGMFELVLFKNEILNFSPEIWWKANGDLESYCIDISQYGNSFSPGILIIRDNCELLRCEGYLAWKF